MFLEKRNRREVDDAVIETLHCFILQFGLSLTSESYSLLNHEV